MFGSEEIEEYFQEGEEVMRKNKFSFAEAKQIGESLGIRWTKFGVEQFRMGLTVELEHGKRDPTTDVTHDLPVVTGKIALAHLNEFPDYYSRLAAMEKEAERETSVCARVSSWGTSSPVKNAISVAMYGFLFVAAFLRGVRRTGERSA